MDPKKVLQMLIGYCDYSQAYEPITEDCVQADNNTKEADDSYLCNPIPENEHVGIDEEKMYFEKEPKPLQLVLFSGKEKDKTTQSIVPCEDGAPTRMLFPPPRLALIHFCLSLYENSVYVLSCFLLIIAKAWKLQMRKRENMTILNLDIQRGTFLYYIAAALNLLS